MTNWDKVKEIFFQELTLSKFENENVYYNICDTINIVRNNQKRKDGVCNFDCTACYKWLRQEYKELILDKAEKEYLTAVIKPWKDRITHIGKSLDGIYAEYISIHYTDVYGGTDTVELPSFKENAMYKGMELNKKYTLEELGL
jgi:hypothetical protein